ncbi:hypothetical protein ABH926_002622 [Catenulispora sp. GP43]|uniref:hypothetical protein n=1 Tax=Catenulispora sp. GP43 TaxID=3156263 RepID=UPI003511231A
MLATSSSTGTPPKSIRISSTNRSTTSIAAPGKAPRSARHTVITGYGLNVDIPLEPMLASPKQAALSHG